MVFGEPLSEVASSEGFSLNYLYNDRSKHKAEWDKITAHFQDDLIRRYRHAIYLCGLKLSDRTLTDEDHQTYAAIEQENHIELQKLLKKRYNL